MKKEEESARNRRTTRNKEQEGAKSKDLRTSSKGQRITLYELEGSPRSQATAGASRETKTWAFLPKEPNTANARGSSDT